VIFQQVWPVLRWPLISANEAEEVVEAFEKHAQAYAREFVPRFAEDILKLMQEPKFSERPRAQINFLADSLAGRPNVETRTSRDICGKERAKERAKSPHQIIRKEFYIECTCGYKGPALNDACVANAARRFLTCQKYCWATCSASQYRSRLSSDVTYVRNVVP
jgi:hypothetical protein